MPPRKRVWHRKYRRKRVKCKTEKKLLAWLYETLSEDEVTYQPRYDWCRNVEKKSNRHFPFDYSVEAYRLIIELDGRQHYFKARRSWNPQAVQIRDMYKMDLAIKHGYTVVRLVQEDVWADRNEWEERLLVHLRPHHKPRGVLLDSDNKAEFDPLRKRMQNAGMVGTNI
jgi:very-short-patch-repair endonuclease